MKRRALPDLVDTYWDPHLSRSNLAEPIFGNLGTDTGLTKLVGAGRMLVAVDTDEDVRRFLLESARVRDGKPQLILGRPDHPATVKAIRPGQSVRVSWTWEKAWWGCHTHAAEASAGGLVVDFPRTAFRFPVREHLWSDVGALARMFDGFDVGLSEVEDCQVVNHMGRICGLMNSAVEQERPLLILLSSIGTLFPGRLQTTDGTNLANPVRPPRTIDVHLFGTDLVGVGWRPDVPVTVCIVVNGLTIGFKSRILGGKDTRLTLQWPLTLLRRQRRQQARGIVGARDIIEFSLPIKNPLGVGSGVARPFRVLDVGPGGVGLVFDSQTARDVPGRIRDAELDLYGKLKFNASLEVVGRAPFGNGHVRLACAFRGLEARQERALEVLCQKLQEGGA
jgi:hypothetical protein